MTRPEEHDGVPQRTERKKSRLQETLQENVDLRQENAKLKIQLKKAMQKIGALMVDGLTGVFNNAGLTEILNSDLISSKAAVIYIDLDKFKPINDTYGHDAGDAVLKKVGEILKENIKSDIDIVAQLDKSKPKSQRPSSAMNSVNSRVGGDEFVAIINDVNQNEADNILARLQMAFDSTSIEWEGQIIPIGASLGIALWKTKEEPFSKAKSRADKSMYDRKKAKGHAPRNG